MDKARVMSGLAAAIMFAGCTQTGHMPGPATTGPMDADFVTMFTLALQPGSLTGCIMGDSNKDRRAALLATRDNAVLLMPDGVRYSLNRVRPNVYTGGNFVKIDADLSVRPKRLTVSNNDGACNWAATAA